MNDQQICPRLKAEERLRDLERIRGPHAIKIAENVYSLWRSQHYSINYFAEKYGFDIEKDEFLMDFIDLKIQQETDVEMLPKREKADIRYKIDRHIELQRKACERVYKESTDLSLSFLWAIKYNAETNEVPFLLFETKESDLKKTDGLFSFEKFYKGQKVKRILRTESDRKTYQNTVYVVHDHQGNYVTAINSHGKKTTILSYKLELVEKEQ
jgi:hypothetical protein